MDFGLRQTINHLFRHEYGKMVAVLSKLLGLRHMQTAQDLVQDSLLQALNTWAYNGMPENPSAWLHRVAKNKAIDYLRREKKFRHIIQPQFTYLLQEYEELQTDDLLFRENEIQDSQLRMIFACCHPSIPTESQLALALKVLCGLSVAEIAKAFLASEETIAKRMYRAKEKIRSENIEMEIPHPTELPPRLDAVLNCLYLLFSEGYNSSHPVKLIREDLCHEAMRLTCLLTQNTVTDLPRTNALLALFCFQASRLPARLDEDGNIILLQQQDRSLWYQPLITQGKYYLDIATVGETSKYHIEAAIAYFHTRATTFESTDWKAIYFLYSNLYEHHSNSFVALNKAIAGMYAVDPATALAELTTITDLQHYYLYHTALGEVTLAKGDPLAALQHYRHALNLTRSAPEQQLLREKIELCEVISCNYIAEFN